MYGVNWALPPVGSATARVDPPRLSPDEGLFRPVSDAPKYPVRRRQPADAREGRVRDDDRAAARIERLAQQSWVEGAEPELPVRTTRPENIVFHLGPLAPRADIGHVDTE